MAALAFADPRTFEKSLLRISVGAALGGLVAGALGLVGLAPPALVFPLAGALAARSSGRARWLMGLTGALAGAVATLDPARPLFYLALAGGLAGLALSLGQLLEKQPGLHPVTAGAAALSTLAGALLLVGGAFTISVFESYGIFAAALPYPLAVALRGGAIGFFFGLGEATAHLRSPLDAVEALHARVGGQLTGELSRLSLQALELYRKCREALARAPNGAAQAHVGRALSEVTCRSLELARRWHAVDVELGERAEVEVERRIQEVQKLAGQSTDPSARRQLAAAEHVLLEERVQLQRIRCGRERVLARLHADLALLEHTRFTLLALRCTDAHLMAAELSTLSDNLSALGQELDAEAQAIDEALRNAIPPVPTANALQPIAAIESAPAAPAAEPVRAG